MTRKLEELFDLPTNEDTASAESSPQPSKEELIEISESWTANQEIFFRKMLQQGGQFSVQGRKYTVESRTKDNLDSNGNPPRTVPLMPGERTF
jgi:hypothetical protein